jgi:hypothetical protein
MQSCIFIAGKHQFLLLVHTVRLRCRCSGLQPVPLLLFAAHTRVLQPPEDIQKVSFAVRGSFYMPQVSHSDLQNTSFLHSFADGLDTLEMLHQDVHEACCRNL